jgi:2-amino-4-hydroxy-6-hydroxymethyldihydropteridine diphosphokinase
VTAAGAASLDAAPGAEVEVVLALGANLGDRAATLRAAVRDLAAAGLRVRAVSPAVETDPVGGPEQPDYLNAVVLARTAGSAREVLRAAQEVEERHGRRRGVRWGARTLDVDVIAYDDLVARDDELELPHPRAAERAFVLAPWLAADPHARLPGPRGGAVADLLARAADAAGVRPRPDVDLAAAP